MTEAREISIRPWERRDHEEVQGVLRLLSGEAQVTSEDAPTFVAEIGGRVVGMVTPLYLRDAHRAEGVLGPSRCDSGREAQESRASTR